MATEPLGAHPGAVPTHDLRAYIGVVLDAMEAGTAERDGPLPPGGPATVAARTRQALGIIDDPAAVPADEPAGGTGVLTDDGIGARAALAELTRALAAGAADPADPACAAHLHCPPLAVAVAADLAVSALNPSLDSWDQAPGATTVETEVIAALAGLVGFDPALAAGTMTTGGTESNLMGLLLARDTRDTRATRATRATGGSSDAPGTDPGRLRVFCSRAAHFSVWRAAGLLGLAPGAVVPVDTDTAHRMDPRALRRALAAHGGPAAIVATAGTTDAGAIDPLPDIAAAAREHEHGAWLHVDAAYGGGALLSDRLRGLLAGIGDADSVGLDLHKLGWQPIPAGVFLTRDATPWGRLDTEVAYLNPADDTAAGLTSLLGRSLRTTRRPDAFPLGVTLRALGRRRIGALVDACHDLALHAAATVVAHPRLELAVPVTLTTVVFRYRPPGAVPPSPGTQATPPRQDPAEAGAGATTVHAANDENPVDADAIGVAADDTATADENPATAVGTADTDAADTDAADTNADAVNAAAADTGNADENPAEVDVDAVNAELRRRLLVAGRAVIGRTEIDTDRRVHLKLTLLNPNATTRDVDALLGLVVAAGDAVAAGNDPVASADPVAGRVPTVAP